MAQAEPSNHGQLLGFRFWASALLSSAALLALIVVAMDAGRIKYGAIPLDVAHQFSESAEAFDRSGAGGRGLRIAFLGDSTVGAPSQKGNVPDQLQRILQADSSIAGEVVVHNLASPGLGPFDYYFLAGELAEFEPDQAILLLNLATFSASWNLTFRRPQLAGWIPADHLIAALALPLHRVGVTTDSLLFDMALVELGMLETWRWLKREQTRFIRTRNAVTSAIDAGFGGGAERDYVMQHLAHFDAIYNLPGGRRMSARGVEDRYGEALAGIGPDHPTLQMLAATFSLLRDAGVPTLVYVNPTNVEHIRGLGGYSDAGLRASLDQVARLSRSYGVELADLHDLFPDDHFRDAAGHFTSKNPDSQRKLAAALAGYVREIAAASSGHADGRRD